MGKRYYITLTLNLRKHMELTKEYFEQHLAEQLDKKLEEKLDQKLDQKLDEKLAIFATKDDLKNAIEPLATKQDVEDAVEELARIVATTIAEPMERHFRLSASKQRRPWT